MSEWIEHDGYIFPRCPEELHGVEVELRLRNGKLRSGYAHHWLETWRSMDKNSHDIVAYRIVEKKPTHDPVNKPNSTAVSILQESASIMEERGRQYDSPEGERSMGKAVTAFNAITGNSLRESEGWLLLQLLKDVRDCTTPGKAHEDSLKDCVAYAALKAEARLNGN